jgi:hypothetical protein
MVLVFLELPEHKANMDSQWARVIEQLLLCLLE